MSEIFNCLMTNCFKKYKSEQGLWKHLIAKHGWTKEQYTQHVLDTMDLEAEAEVFSSPQPAPSGTELEEVSPQGDQGQAESALIEPSPAPTATERSSDDDETIAAIMADPLAGPVFATVMEVHGELQQFKVDTVGVLKDINDSIAYLQAVPEGEQDLIGAFDRFVEKYGLEEQVKGIFSAGQTALLSFAGQDPVASDLGSEFIEELKVLKLEKDRQEIEAMGMLKRALARGDKLYSLSPEEVERARKEGFIQEDESDAG